jgi:hypothetical protein
VDTGIGATLRDARNRRKIELSEVEAAIKIRVRYLQAIENEEWDALPGGAYTRGFVRTYAYYLGLDGERLADDYRRITGPVGGDRVPKRVEPVPMAGRQTESPFSRRILVAVVCLALVALVVGIGLAGGDGDSPAPTPVAKGEGEREGKPGKANGVDAKPGVALKLVATREVWVCLLDTAGKALVDGEILEAGDQSGPFRSGGFELALGNGSARIFLDGRLIGYPETSSPLGYAIDGMGELADLEEGERPDCE